MSDVRYELLMQVYGLLDEDIGTYIKESGYGYGIEYDEDTISLWIVSTGINKLICYYELNKLLYLIMNYETEKKEIIKYIDKFIKEVEKNEKN